MSGISSSSSGGSSSSSSSLALYERIKAVTEAESDTPFGRALDQSITVMCDALRLYGPDQLVASFNGGKDAVVILHLTLAALAAHNNATGEAKRLRVIFFEVPDEFPEIDAFVRDTVSQHGLELVSSSLGFADGLRSCIAEHGSSAFVLGTRGSDPNAGGQQAFTPSSDWMPPFMRVNPILTWSYADVWTFLRRFELPYSPLYDAGYTSLGKMTNTQKNPALVRADGSYAPAYTLTDETLERAGRVARQGAGAGAGAGGAAAEDAATEDAATARISAASAALLIVGDEILGGKTADGNTLVAAKRLRAAGVSLRRVCVVADEMEDIVGELSRLCAKYDVVFTSGGLGPTHDDITLKGVAAALGMQMQRSEAMVETIQARYAAAVRCNTQRGPHAHHNVAPRALSRARVGCCLAHAHVHVPSLPGLTPPSCAPSDPWRVCSPLTHMPSPPSPTHTHTHTHIHRARRLTTRSSTR
jgi:FAD synthetase